MHAPALQARGAAAAPSRAAMVLQHHAGAGGVTGSVGSIALQVTCPTPSTLKVKQMKGQSLSLSCWVVAGMRMGLTGARMGREHVFVCAHALRAFALTQVDGVGHDVGASVGVGEGVHKLAGMAC